MKIVSPGYNVVLTEIKAMSLDPEMQRPSRYSDYNLSSRSKVSSFLHHCPRYVVSILKVTSWSRAPLQALPIAAALRAAERRQAEQERTSPGPFRNLPWSRAHHFDYNSLA